MTLLGFLQRDERARRISNRILSDDTLSLLSVIARLLTFRSRPLVGNYWNLLAVLSPTPGFQLLLAGSCLKDRSAGLAITLRDHLHDFLSGLNTHRDLWRI